MKVIVDEDTDKIYLKRFNISPDKLSSGVIPIAVLKGVYCRDATSLYLAFIVRNFFLKNQKNKFENLSLVI